MVNGENRRKTGWYLRIEVSLDFGAWDLGCGMPVWAACEAVAFQPVASALAEEAGGGWRMAGTPEVGEVG